MKKPKLIILAWLLLLVPTLLLGVGALRLLRSEEARLESGRRSTAVDRVGTMAGNIDLGVAEVQDGLLETLSLLPQGDLSGQLDDWKRGNPLVRNVFIWQRGRGLTWPDPEQPASDEEAAFIRRYLSLFADQSGWREPPLESDGAPRGEAAGGILAERKELRQLAKQGPLPPDRVAGMAAEPAEAPASAAAAPHAGGRGWRSWYADDQLHLLGWFAPEGSDLRYGVEVEMMALLSRLLGNLPGTPPAGESYALLNGNGAIFHQTGTFEVLPGRRPLAVAAVASLPHWQVAAYSDPKSASPGGGFRLIGSLLVGTFIVAILLGGSLLLWQAYRNQRDARQKTSFVSNVSHELKTPLTTIRLYAELLGEGKIGEAEKRQRYLQTIIKESQRLTRLVGNVLDFSRLEQGSRSYRHEDFNVAQLLGELLERQGPRLAEAGLELSFEGDPGPLPLCSDRDALEQIILNLLDNAIKYAHEGKLLQVVLKAQGDRCTLRLRDFGPGIPAGHRQRIFDKFHRVDTDLTARCQGSGLGLSIARQLAEGLGGTLSYTPAPGGGACFELSLPLKEGRP